MIIEIEIGRAPTHKDRWVLAGFDWIRKDQGRCVHSVWLKMQCNKCREMSREAAMEEGEKASMVGESLDSCPYGISTYGMNYHAWCLGWDIGYLKRKDKQREGSP